MEVMYVEEAKAPLLEIRPKRESDGKQFAWLILLAVLLLLCLALPLREAARMQMEEEGLLGELSIIFMEFFGANDYVYILFKFFSAIGLIMTTMCIVSSMQNMGAKGLLLMADDDGIIDNVSEFKLGQVPWDDIHDIELKTHTHLGVKRNIIEITLKSGDKYMPVIRKQRKKKPQLTGAGMLETHIALRDVDADIVQIAVVLRELLAEHRKTITVYE